MNFTVTSLPPEADEVTFLTTVLHQDLELKYGQGNLEDFLAENKNMLVFFIVNINDTVPAACGGLKHFDSNTAEIKRMYVRNEFRGMGLSKLILVKLEEAAVKMNYNRIILETGLKQPVAMKLYENSGYTRINPYGRYKDDPDSICFEKVNL